MILSRLYIDWDIFNRIAHWKSIFHSKFNLLDRLSFQIVERESPYTWFNCMRGHKNVILNFHPLITGPTKLTVDDMWRMVWEQGSCSIVMVTSLIELGKVS
jgi:hypothetical protein